MNSNLSRRKFLLSFYASLLVPELMRTQETVFAAASQKKAQSEETIVVIGAGAAGLGAARKLKLAGVKVIVLEARDRIGGRVWTDRSLKNIPLDLGASWIHGIEGNPLTALVRQYEVETVSTDYDNVALYDAQGTEFTDRQQDQLDTRYSRIMRRVRRQGERAQQQGRPDASLQSAISAAIAENSWTAEEKLQFDYLINTNLEHEFAADASELSWFSWDEGEEIVGGDVLFPGGYGQIFSRLAEGLDIRFGQMVQKIEYSESQVTVVTRQGSIVAQRLIVTVPLGVLKRGSIQFSPALPERKQAAIQRLGMGLLNKVFLHFPRVFWDRESDLLGYIGPRKGEWAEWYNFFKFTGEPVLLGFNAATYARRLEALSNEAIVADSMTALRRMYGNSIPAPDGSTVTRWASDPLSFGSYSFLAPGSSASDRDALAEPVSNRLFFAGEATFRDFPATVHGALLSGEREAARILSLAKPAARVLLSR